MAVTLSISASDVSAAASLLEQYMTDAVPDGDFRKGTALRDLTVQAIAAVYAFVRAEANQIRQMQSLNSVQAATSGDTEALTDAVNGILSNVFITPKAGSRGRGQVIGHATQQVDIFITPNTRFTKTSGLVFVVDSDTTYFISKSQLTPVIDANNSVIEYTFIIPLVAVKTGTEGNIAPGLFASFDRFSVAVSYIENIDWFSGGRGAETIPEVLARAPTALSVRNLINERSITAVLNDNFGDVIRGIFVVGMGMPEMQRDKVPSAAPHLDFHVGGATDIYLALDSMDATFEGVVGDLYARPDGLITIFRDASVSFASVVAGDILHISAGLPVVPSEFLVVENRGTELVVSESAGFPLATDEASPTTQVSYTVGTITSTQGVTSRRSSRVGAVVLPAGPVVEITDVAVLDPLVGEEAYKSPTDGFIHFAPQVNSLTGNAGLWFSTQVNNPLYAQSAQQWMELLIGVDEDMVTFNGRQLRVRYRTLAGFAAIDSFVRSRRERTSAASQLPRAHSPVSVWTSIYYKLKSTATSTLDNSAIARAVATYINQIDTAIAPIDTSGIETFIRNTYPSIASIVPLTISYVLLTPTGALRYYESVDEVRITLTKQVSGATDSLAPYGVSDRTIRYVASLANIRAQQVY